MKSALITWFTLSAQQHPPYPRLSPKKQPIMCCSDPRGAQLLVQRPLANQSFGLNLIGSELHGLSVRDLSCQSSPRGAERWQMPAPLSLPPVNSAWNGCLISFEWLFLPAQTICHYHVVKELCVKQKREKLVGAKYQFDFFSVYASRITAKQNIYSNQRLLRRSQLFPALFVLAA